MDQNDDKEEMQLNGNREQRETKFQSTIQSCPKLTGHGRLEKAQIL